MARRGDASAAVQRLRSVREYAEQQADQPERRNESTGAAASPWQAGYIQACLDIASLARRLLGERPRPSPRP